MRSPRDLAWARGSLDSSSKPRAKARRAARSWTASRWFAVSVATTATIGGGATRGSAVNTLHAARSAPRSKRADHDRAICSRQATRGETLVDLAPEGELRLDAELALDDASYAHLAGEHALLGETRAMSRDGDFHVHDLSVLVDRHRGVGIVILRARRA